MRFPSNVLGGKLIVYRVKKKKKRIVLRDKREKVFGPEKDRLFFFFSFCI